MTDQSIAHTGVEATQQEGETEHNSHTTATPVSATALARCILDVDEERVEEHLIDVALAVKAEVCVCVLERLSVFQFHVKNLMWMRRVWKST